MHVRTLVSAPVRGCICRACMHGWVSATSYVPKGHLFVSWLVSKAISLFWKAFICWPLSPFHSFSCLYLSHRPFRHYKCGVGFQDNHKFIMMSCWWKERLVDGNEDSQKSLKVMHIIILLLLVCEAKDKGDWEAARVNLYRVFRPSHPQNWRTTLPSLALGYWRCGERWTFTIGRVPILCLGLHSSSVRRERMGCASSTSAPKRAKRPVCILFYWFWAVCTAVVHRSAEFSQKKFLILVKLIDLDI
jgi:hypothetical protein